MIHALRHLAGASLLLAGTAAAAPARPDKDGAALAERNMFCSTCRSVDGRASARPPATSRLQLVATHVAAAEADSLATIVDLTGERGGAYGVGQALPGGGTLVRIGRTFVDVEAGAPARVERIALAGLAPAVAAAAPVAPALDGIRRVDETSFEIERALVERLLADPTAIGPGGRVVPAVKDGVPVGFKLFAIRPSSLYARLGLMNGDTINAVNGFELTTMDKVLEVYTKVRESSHLSIGVTRRGRPLSMSYSIK